MPTLDALFNTFAKQVPVTDKGFDPTHVLTSKTYIAESSNTLVVIIPPWHTSESFRKRLTNRYVRAGYSVLSYSYDDAILSADPSKTIVAFEIISKEVSTDIKEARQENHRLNHVYFVSGSLGCAITTYIMGEQRISGNAELVVPGGNLAAALWSGIRTQHLRRLYESQGLTERDLRDMWSKLAPAYQARQNVRNSHFRLIISQADRVITPDSIPEFADNLRASGNAVEIKVNRYLGHYGTIVRETMVRRSA